MDIVYTPPSSVASYSRRHGWECVCLCAPWVHERCVHVCVWGLWEKERTNRTKSWHEDEHGFTPHSPNNFTIFPVDSNYRSTRGVKASLGENPPTTNVVCSPHKVNVFFFSSIKGEQLGAVIRLSGGSHFRASSHRGGIVVQSQLINMLSVAVAVSLCFSLSHCAKTRHKIG